MTDDNRLARLVGRDALRRITNDLRCHDCGVQAHSPVGLRLSDGVASAAGLVSCGRIWLCPTCNAKVMASRALEVGMALTYAQANKLLVGWGSVTVRHNMHDKLEHLLKLQSLSWAEVTNSVAWRRADVGRRFEYVPHVHDTIGDPCDPGLCTRRNARHQHDYHCPPKCRRRADKILGPFPGRVGYVRAAEINIGSNGWHPHFHPIILWVGSAESFAAFLDDVVTEWIVGVEKFGGEALRNGGQQLRVLDGPDAFKQLDKYVTKSTYALALEAVWSQSKTGRTAPGKKARTWGTESHWALLARIAVGLRSDGVANDVERWWDFETAVKGHRMIAWSRNLRRLAGVGEEATDEELAAREHGSAEDTVCFITPGGWAQLAVYPEVVSELFTTLEASGWVGLRALLDAWDISYTLPAGPSGASMSDTLADRLADYLA